MFIHEDPQHRRVGGTLFGLAAAFLFVLLQTVDLVPVALAFQ